MDIFEKWLILVRARFKAGTISPTSESPSSSSNQSYFLILLWVFANSFTDVKTNIANNENVFNLLRLRDKEGNDIPINNDELTTNSLNYIGQKLNIPRPRLAAGDNVLMPNDRYNKLLIICALLLSGRYEDALFVDLFAVLFNNYNTGDSRITFNLHNAFNQSWMVEIGLQNTLDGRVNNDYIFHFLLPRIKPLLVCFHFFIRTPGILQYRIDGEVIRPERAYSVGEIALGGAYRVTSQSGITINVSNMPTTAENPILSIRSHLGRVVNLTVVNGSVTFNAHEHEIYTVFIETPWTDSANDKLFYVIENGTEDITVMDLPPSTPFSVTLRHIEFSITDVRFQSKNIQLMNKQDSETLSHPLPHADIASHVHGIVFSDDQYRIHVVNPKSTMDITSINSSVILPLRIGSLNFSFTIAITFRQDIYIGGNFTDASGTSVTRFTRWNGTSYENLSATFNAEVSALSVYDNNLYIGGSFNNGVVSWNGEDYTQLQTRGGSGNNGLNGSVSVFLEYQGLLYIAGSFSQANGESTAYNNMISWNGTEFNQTGSGTNNNIWELAVYNNKMYVAGRFSMSGSTSINRLATYNTSNNEFVQVGDNHLEDNIEHIYSLYEYNGKLYIGGHFWGQGTNQIATWNDTEFEQIGSGSNGPVRDTIAFQNTLYVIGRFSILNSVRNVIGIAKYAGTAEPHPQDDDGSDKTSTTPNLRIIDREAEKLAATDSLIYVGGDFTNVNSQPNGSIRRIFSYNGTSIIPMGSSGVNNDVGAILPAPSITLGDMSVTT